jgi:Phage major capsid protein E
MTIRSFTNQFEVVDETANLLKLPQTWTLLGDSGLFAEESITTQVATFQEINGSLSIIGDAVRGSKPQTTSGDVRKLHSYSVSHHPFMDALYPSDIAGVSAYGNLSQEETQAAALLRKMEKARKSFAITREIARFKTLGTGMAWTPNGTIASSNFYTDLGYTRKEVNFDLATPSTDVIAKCEEIIANFQSTGNEGEIITRVVGYCSPAFFSKLIAHAKVTQAHIYQQIGSTNITQERAGGMGLYRKLSFGGIQFIEVPTVLAGTSLVTSGDCIFVAEGTDCAKTFYAPANRFGHVGTLGQMEYMWTFNDPRMTEITIEAESNMINTLLKPQFVSRGYTA